MNLDAMKDTKINFDRVLMEDNALTPTQTALIALSCGYALRDKNLLAEINNRFAHYATENLVYAAKICSSLMAMNNIYYRFTHLVKDQSFSAMNPMLRMSGLGNHGMNQIDFELAALAVSALNGCGMCMDAHTEKLKKEQASKESIQAAIRIAAVLNAVTVGVST